MRFPHNYLVRLFQFRRPRADLDSPKFGPNFPLCINGLVSPSEWSLCSPTEGSASIGTVKCPSVGWTPWQGLWSDAEYTPCSPSSWVERSTTKESCQLGLANVLLTGLLNMPPKIRGSTLGCLVLYGLVLALQHLTGDALAFCALNRCHIE